MAVSLWVADQELSKHKMCSLHFLQLCAAAFDGRLPVDRLCRCL